MFKNPIIVFIIFLVIGLGVYANSFVNEFVWDDYDIITNNNYIKDWKYFPRFFTENLIAGCGQTTDYYRPIILISFAIDYHIWGINQFGFHLVNTLIHILVAWLAFLMLSKLLEKIKEKEKIGIDFSLLAFLVSLFFLVHPLQTEAVTYIAGRADPLSSVFSLLAIIFYINFRNKEGKRILNYAFCVLFFLLGLLTKEQVILMPALILLIDWIFFTDKLNKESIKRIIFGISPFFLISVVYFILHITVFDFKKDETFGFDDPGFSHDPIHRILTFTFVMLSYLRLLFFPTGLHMAWEVEYVTSFFSFSVIGFIALFLLLCFLCVLFWKKTRLPTFGFLWFLIILLPRTNVMPINRPMYEHWLYLPMLGFWLAVFVLVYLLLEKINKKIIRNIAFGFLIFLFIFFSVLTIKRNFDWRSPIIFYKKNLEYTPNSFIQHNNLGIAYSNQGEYEKAIVEYKKAIELNETAPQPRHNLGNALDYLGKYDEAILEYEKVLELSDYFLPTYQNLFNLYVKIGNKDKALEVQKEYLKKIEEQK